jgi:hypothetical protein
MQQLITQQTPVAQKFERPFRFDLLTVSSQDAQYTGEGDYAFVFKQNPINDAKTIQLYSYSIPWSFYNVTKFTNTFIFSEGVGANITSTIPVGQYSVYDLQTALASSMTTAGTQTYTVTFNNVTSLLTVSAPTTAFTFHFTGTTLCKLIGLTANITSSGVTNSLTFQDMIDLLPSKYLTVKLPNLINTCSSSDSLDQSAIAVIPFSGYNFGDTMREQESGIELKLAKKDLSLVIISIVDQNLFTPDFDPLEPWSMTFRVSHIN